MYAGHKQSKNCSSSRMFRRIWLIWIRLMLFLYSCYCRTLHMYLCMCTSTSNHLLNTRYVCNNIEIPPYGFSLWTTSVIACKDRYPTTLEVYNFYGNKGRDFGCFHTTLLQANLLVGTRAHYSPCLPQRWTCSLNNSHHGWGTWT